MLLWWLLLRLLRSSRGQHRHRQWPRRRTRLWRGRLDRLRLRLWRLSRILRLRRSRRSRPWLSCLAIERNGCRRPSWWLGCLAVEGSHRSCSHLLLCSVRRLCHLLSLRPTSKHSRCRNLKHPVLLCCCSLHGCSLGLY